MAEGMSDIPRPVLALGRNNMRPLALLTTVALMIAILLCGSNRVHAQSQGNGQGAVRPGRLAQVPSGVGFYNPRNRSPGFTYYPSPASYNSVSFYGRSYNPNGFSPYPNGEPYYPPGMAGGYFPAPVISPYPSGPIYNGQTYTHYRDLIPGYSFPYGGGPYNNLDFYPPGPVQLP
jgi:hypothetical protein